MANHDQTMPTLPAILRLPDELLEAIVSFLPPHATITFGATCKQANKITYEPLVWRRHCIQTWRYWEDRHNISEKLELPPAQTKWKQLYDERQRGDEFILDVFNKLLLRQSRRVSAMEDIAKRGCDAKDVLLRLRNETPDSAVDVLARRYHAKAILGQIHRAVALGKWDRLHRQQMIRLEEVLGAFDLFVLNGDTGDLSDLSSKLDNIARGIKDRDPEFDELSTRRKAIQIARYLRSENLVGMRHLEHYHDLRHNFLSLALFDHDHSSLPLQSVAIYCAVARRLGVVASPSNFPQHVHAVIKAPDNQTLDGKARQSNSEEDPEQMHMDPWRSSDEVPQDQLRLRLTQMGAPSNTHSYHMGSTRNLEVALRAGRNIMTSVQELRNGGQSNIDQPSMYAAPDVEAAWYAMLWSMIMLGDSSSPAAALQLRRQCLPYLIEHYKTHCPEDLGLMEKYIIPMFAGEREADIVMHHVHLERAKDNVTRAPTLRVAENAKVVYKVGTSFTHRRYGYEGIIVGWDNKCNMGDDWIQQMGVEQLPRGQAQPFYNTIDEDRRARYVAEENIVVNREEPSEAIMQFAGRYFKRWDREAGMFVHNMKEQYPDD